MNDIRIIGRAVQKATHTQIQQAFIEYVQTRHASQAKYIVKITNEGKRSPREGAKLKKEGLHKGAYDLFYPVPKYQRLASGNNGEWPVKFGLWIEIKKDKDKVTDEQHEFGILMRAIGHDAVICFGLDMAIEVFEDYINGKELTKYFQYQSE